MEGIPNTGGGEKQRNQKNKPDLLNLPPWLILKSLTSYHRSARFERQYESPGAADTSNMLVHQEIETIRAEMNQTLNQAALENGYDTIAKHQILNSSRNLQLLSSLDIQGWSETYSVLSEIRSSIQAIDALHEPVTISLQKPKGPRNQAKILEGFGEALDWLSRYVPTYELMPISMLGDFLRKTNLTPLLVLLEEQLCSLAVTFTEGEPIEHYLHRIYNTFQAALDTYQKDTSAKVNEYFSKAKDPNNSGWKEDEFKKRLESDDAFAKRIEIARAIAQVSKNNAMLVEKTIQAGRYSMYTDIAMSHFVSSIDQALLYKLGVSTKNYDRLQELKETAISSQSEVHEDTQAIWELSKDLYLMFTADPAANSVPMYIGDVQLRIEPFDEASKRAFGEKEGYNITFDMGENDVGKSIVLAYHLGKQRSISSGHIVEPNGVIKEAHMFDRTMFPNGLHKILHSVLNTLHKTRPTS